MAPKAQHFLKTVVFLNGACTFQFLLARWRPALSAEGTQLVKMTKIATKLEGQNRSVVAPFDLLTPPFCSVFRCAKLFRKGSGADFGARSGEILGRLGNGVKIELKLGLENMELDGFGVVVAPFGLGLAVVRGTGPKFYYGPLFWPIGAPGAQ